MCQYEKSPGQEASIAATCNGPSQYQGDGVGRCTAKGAPDLEHKKCCKEDPFNAEKCVEFAEEQLRGGRCKEIGWSYLGVSFELVVESGTGLGEGRLTYSSRTTQHLLSCGIQK